MPEFLKILYFSYFFLFYSYFYPCCLFFVYVYPLYISFLTAFLFFLPSVFYLFPQTKNYFLSFFPLRSAKIFSFFFLLLILLFSCISITFSPNFPFNSPVICIFYLIFPCLAIFSFPYVFYRLSTFFVLHFMVLIFLFCYHSCMLCYFTLFLPVLYCVLLLLYFLLFSFLYLYLHQFFIFFAHSNFILHRFSSSIFQKYHS